MSQQQRTILIYVILSIAILLFSGYIVYKMADNTLIHAAEWNARAEAEMSQTEIEKPVRGDILACDGRVLATNLRVYTMRIDYTSEQFREKNLRASCDSLCDSLAHYFPIRTKAEWRAHLLKPLEVIAKDPTLSEKKRRARMNSWPLLVKIPYGDVLRVKGFPFFKINQSAKTGLVVEAITVREKPFGELARRSIGNVYDPADTLRPGLHGRTGLEGALDSLLYGTPGLYKKVSLTRKITNWTDKPSIPGYHVQTTIDVDIQDIVENELLRVLDTTAADWGTAVLMEVATGDIKAISNLERDPSTGRYNEGVNHAVLTYEPGSVIKPISMLIALEDGLVKNLDEHIPTGGAWAYLGKNPIKDSHAHPSVAVRDVICYSSNIATAKIILRGYENNPSGFVERLASIGFLDNLHAGLAGEGAPKINPHPKKIDLSRMAYGYTTQLPPLHTLSIYNAIANDGRYVRPRMYSRLIGQDTIIDLPVSYVRDRICSSKNAAILREMLHAVVWKDGGTGRLVRSSKVEIAGKTGTCYMIDGGGYNTGKKRLAFCGFFPYSAPKYSCIVLTAWPKRNMMGAASTSGQVMKNIALKLYARGLLDNKSDFTADRHENSTAALYATSTDENAYESLSASIPIKGSRRGRNPRTTPSGTVPEVTGLGMREAVNRLEQAGYSVTITGKGYVMKQTPAAGDTIPPGHTVTLHLTQDT